MEIGVSTYVDFLWQWHEAIAQDVQDVGGACQIDWLSVLVVDGAAIQLDLQINFAHEVTCDPSKRQLDLRALADLVDVCGEAPSDIVLDPHSEWIAGLDLRRPRRRVARGSTSMCPVVGSWNMLPVRPVGTTASSFMAVPLVLSCR